MIRLLSLTMPGRRRIVPALLAAITGLLVIAGLHPFDFARRNGATWLKPGPGLRFEKRAVAFSRNRFRWDTRSATAALSLELWLRSNPAPDVEPRTWLALLDDSSLPPMAVLQKGADLVIRDAVTNPPGDRWYNLFEAPDVIRPGTLQHFVITSDSTGLKLYVDGSPATIGDGFGIPLARQGRPFGGLLVIGAGPPWDAPWPGEFLGLALYDQALPADRIARLARSRPAEWITEVRHAPGILALYGFDKGSGTVVADRSGGEHPLFLPRFYHPPGQRILAPVDRKDFATWWNALDALLNFAGFLPFGFLLTLLLLRHLPPVQAVAAATLVGFGLSLGIELLQVWMITRTSSLQDVILNTSGTLAGAFALRTTGS